MGKYSIEEKEESKQSLKKYLDKGINQIFYNVEKVSPSGMSRHISFYIATDKNTILDISQTIATLSDNSIKDKGVFVSGCGMDMAFALLNDAFCELGEPYYKDWQRKISYRGL